MSRGTDGGEGDPLDPILAAFLVAALAAAVFGWLFVAYRRRLHTLLGRDPGYPIPTVELGAFDERFEPGPFGVSLEAEVTVLPELGKVVGGVNPREQWILAAFARGARRMFEFGTAPGRTTHVWARNAQPDAIIGTITLAPEDRPSYARDAGDSDEARRVALEETCFRSFVYNGTDVEPKVRQYFGDSKQFDESDWVGLCDVVFVDGSHAGSYVRSDSEKAMRMVRPGGVILWHDYRGPRGVCRDVFRYLNQLGRTLSLVRLSGTRIVAWRAPATHAPATAAPG